MKKRILCLLLVVCSILTLVAPAQAATTQCGPVEHDSSWRLNPHYADILDESDLPQPAKTPAYAHRRANSDYMTEAQAVAYMRQQLVDRQSTIVMNYTSTKGIYDSADGVIAEAMAHTGVPVEGDYLERQYASYHWNADHHVNYNDGLRYITITYTMVYFTTVEQEAQVDRAVDRVLAELDLQGNTPYQQIRSIYDYIISHVDYDYYHLEDDSYKLKHSCYAALIQGTAVCQGFAVLFYRLALELGIDCRYISGIGAGGSHGWNIVELDGKYYNLDSTWDEDAVTPEWFLLSPTDFYDHYRNEQFETASFHSQFPMHASSYVYDPVKSNIQITKKPASVNVAEGETAKIGVKALGEGLKYTWYIKDPGSTDYTKSSVTGSTYSFSMTAAKSGRKIYCVITDTYGNKLQTNTVTAGKATVLKITQQPKSGVAPVGEMARTTVKAQGDGLKYTWYIKDPGSANYKRSSLTGSTYSFTMSKAKSGRQVYCKITDSYGNTVKTKTVTLSIGTPLKITAQPKSVVVAKGATAEVTVGVQGEGLTYKWYFAPKGSSDYAYTSSFKGKTYSVAMDPSRNGRKIYCVITDKFGNSVRTNTVSLNMKVTITTQPKSVTALSGKNAKVTVAAAGNGLRYEWWFAERGSTTFTKTTSFTGKTYQVAMNAARHGRRVYCVITDQYGNKVKSNVVTLKQESTLKLRSQTVSVMTALGETAEVTVEATGDGLTYTWYYANEGGSFVKSASTTGDTYSVTMSETRAGRRVYCVIRDKYGNKITSRTVTLELL